MIDFLMLVNNPDLAKAAQENLSPHGKVWMLHNAKSMSSGYNTLIPHALADVLCLIHQDTALHFDAATILPQYFSLLPRPGVLGFCGTSRYETGRHWYECGHRYGSLSWGETYDPSLNMRFEATTRSGSGLGYEPVEVLDGYCLVVLRAVAQQIMFDEDFDNWHGYDTDFCLRVLKAGYQNYVINQPTHHIGSGHDEEQKRRAIALVEKKWNSLIAERRSSPSR